MSLFKNYKNCIYCRSSSLKKLKNQFIPMNFYLEDIMSDLKITKNQLKKMKIYECENCTEILKPKAGDCCVFCSFGTIACPPIQENNSCC